MYVPDKCSCSCVHYNKWHKCPCIAVNGIMWLRAWAQSVVINVCFFMRHSWLSGDNADGECSERLHWLRQLKLPAKTNSRITCFSEQDSYKPVLRECLDPSPRWLRLKLPWDGGRGVLGKRRRGSCCCCFLLCIPHRGSEGNTNIITRNLQRK